MENQQHSLPAQPSQKLFNLSPAVVMFFVLAALLALVGLYVTNRDIETRGITVLESTVPLQFESGAAGLSGRYPDGWRYTESEDSLVFRPTNARTDDPTSITLTRLQEAISPRELATQIENNAQSVLDDVTNYDQLPSGITLSVRESDRIAARHIIFADAESGLFVATLRSENANDYSRELEAMAQTLDALRPFALTQRAERPEFSVPYPEGFTDTPQDDSVVFLTQEDGAIDNTQAIIIQMILADPNELLGPDLAGATTADAALFVGSQLSGSLPETDVYPVQLDVYAGSQVILASQSSTDVIIELTVLDLGDENFFFILARTTRTNYPKVSVTVEAMIAGLEYENGVPTGVDAVNDARSEDVSASEEPVSEESASEEPVSEESASEEPVSEEPVSEESASEETSSAEPPSSEINYEGAALPLTQAAERPAFSLDYPEGWQEGETDTVVIAVFADTEDNDSMAIQAILGTSEDLFGAPVEQTATDQLLFTISQQFTGLVPASDLTPVTLGGYDGHELLLVPQNNVPQVAGLVLLDLRDGNYLLLSTRSTPTEYGVIRATLADMLDTLVLADVTEASE